MTNPMFYYDLMAADIQTQAQRDRIKRGDTRAINRAHDEERLEKTMLGNSKAKLELAIRARELVDAEEFKLAMMRAAVTVRQRMQALPNELAPMLEGLETYEIAEMMRKSIDIILNELAEALKKGFSVSEADEQQITKVDQEITDVNRPYGNPFDESETGSA